MAARRILLADDEAMEIQMLEAVIGENFEEQVEVVTAANGHEALARYQERPADVAVLDIEMPEMSGTEVAHAIRALGRPCQIIFLTAYDDFAYMKEAIHVRALDYLLKPFDEEEFVALLEEAFRGSEAAAPGAVRNAGAADGAAEREASAEAGESAVRKAGADGEAAAPSEMSGEREGRLVSAIRAFLEENYMRPISMHDAAERMNYSDVYFCKLFKQYFQENFTAYLTHFRLEKARELLADPAVSVKAAGSAVGYPDQNYFTRVFKRSFGCSPSEYRERSLS